MRRRGFLKAVVGGLAGLFGLAETSHGLTLGRRSRAGPPVIIRGKVLGKVITTGKYTPTVLGKLPGRDGALEITDAAVYRFCCAGPAVVKKAKETP
jgi:hypothetical protein